jgi:Uma2 family endonuclease
LTQRCGALGALDEEATMTPTALAYARPSEPIHYPESDGRPMAETDEHRDEMAEIIQALQQRYLDREDVYVSGNVLIYYEEGNPAARRAPDVFVVFGVPKRKRRTYLLWKERVVPQVAIELTSKGTRNEDEKVKLALYARLGVEYCFLYDPLAEYLDPPLQGYRLRSGGRYQPMSPRAGRLPCPPLGLDLYLDEKGRLQFVDRETGTRLVRVPEALRQTTEALERREEALQQTTQALEQKDEALRQTTETLRHVEASNREMTAEIERLRAALRKARSGETE